MLFSQAEAYALLAIGSDHSPIILSTAPQWTKRKKEFKFEVFWLDHPEYKDFVRDIWNDQHGPVKDLALKMKEMAAALIKWSKG